MTESLVIIREFAAPRETVWDAWTDPTALALWYGPRGSSVEILKFDLRPGGVWLTRMISGARIMHTHVKFREVSAPERLVWEHANADADGNVARSPMMENWPLVVLTEAVFTALAGGRTRLDLNWRALDATDAERAALEAGRDMMTNGWGSSFGRLDEYLAQLDEVLAQA